MTHERMLARALVAAVVLAGVPGAARADAAHHDPQASDAEAAAAPSAEAGPETGASRGPEAETGADASAGAETGASAGAETAPEPGVEADLEAATPPPAKPAPVTRPGFRFLARERLVSRAAEGDWGGEGDTDGQLFVAASGSSADGALVGDLALTLWSDLDGVPRGVPTVFGSVYDRARSPIWIDVMSLWVGIEGEGVLREVRLGRQVTEHGTPVALDGVSLQLALWEPYLSLFVVGGRTVHFFSIDQERYEDWLGSAGLTVRPLPGLRLEADYRFSREGNALGEELLTSSYGIAAWYRPASWMNLRAYLRGVDDALSQVGAAARLVCPDWDVGLEARLHVQPMALDELDVREDPYFLTLGQSDPFLRWRLDAWAGLETSVGTFALHLGGDGRHLLGVEESPFNRNLGRLYARATAQDLFGAGLYAFVSFERDSDRFELDGHGLWAVTGALGYEAATWRVELGSSFDQYKYTYYQSVDELEDVRAFYLDGRFKLLGWLTLRARYELELLAWTSHTVTLSLTQEF